MDQSLYHSMIRHRLCDEVGVCIGCNKPLEQGGLQCHLCLFCRYCSHACLKYDRQRHKPVCNLLHHFQINDIELLDDILGRTNQLLFRARLLDSEGDFISPEVIHEAYLVRGADASPKSKINLTAESKSDTVPCKSELQRHSSEQNYIKISLPHLLSQNSNGKATDTEEGHLESAREKHRVQYSGSDLGNGQFSWYGYVKTKRTLDLDSDQETSGIPHAKLSKMDFKGQQQKARILLKTDEINRKRSNDTKNSAFTDSQVTNVDQCSSSSFSDKRSSSRVGASNEAARPDTFGKGWWSKNTKPSPNKFKQENKSKQAPCNDKILGEKNANIQIPSSYSDSSDSAGSNSVSRHIAESHSTSSHSAVSQSISSCGANSNIASRDSVHINSAVSHSVDNCNQIIHSVGSSIASSHSTGNHSIGNHNTDNHSTDSLSTEKSHSTNSDPHAHNISHSSSQTRQNSDPDTFGSGWWQVKKPAKTNTATSFPTKQTKLNPGEKGHKQRNNSAVNTSSSSSAVSSGTSSNSALNNTQNNPAKNVTREQSDSDSFGSGWWKHRFVNNSKRKTDSAQSKTDCIPSKVNKPDEHRISESCSEFVNRCTDVVPYKVYLTLELILKFVKVATHIDSSLIEEQANHGRVLAMVLTNVPGLWRASLGGSRISLLVEIVGRYPSKMLGLVIRDKYGHTAPVLLNAESSMYTVPDTFIQIPYSDCIKPGNFIILRAVCWEQLPNGKLAIIMRNIKNVAFIFYEMLG